MNSSMSLASSAANSPTSRKVSTWRSGITSRCVSAFGLMSRTATKPSAARTWSPSRTSWQKRQSSGSEDPLLGHAARPHADELAELASHQPGRVVVAVDAARAVDEYDVLASHLRAPALEARHPRVLTQARAALALDVRRDGVGGRRRRPRPRRIGKDVDARDPCARDDPEGPAKGALGLAPEAHDHPLAQGE